MLEVVSWIVTVLGLIGLVVIPVAGVMATITFLKGFEDEKDRIRRLRLREPWEREFDE